MYQWTPASSSNTSPWSSTNGSASRLFSQNGNAQNGNSSMAPRNSSFPDHAYYHRVEPEAFLRVSNLPPKASHDSVRLLLLWADALCAIHITHVNSSDDGEGSSCALISFYSYKEASIAHEIFEQYSKSLNACLVVEILDCRTNASDYTTTSPAVSQGPFRSQPALSFTHQAFSSSDNISPTSTAPVFSQQARASSYQTSSYQAIYSPQSPIGSHISEKNRMSGKSLIKRDLGDDETSDLLRDPVAYAKNGHMSGRRATAPQIPLASMGRLSLANSHVSSVSHASSASHAPSVTHASSASHAPSVTHASSAICHAPSAISHAPSANSPPCPSSVPQYNHIAPHSPHAVTGHMVQVGQHLMYSNNHYQPRHSTFPPVNPADQNPPCNTLYVGNLPIDTSEEELKAIFSKQRGYKRLCFRTKQNGPMCFVEFEDVAFATRALTDMYGHLLHNSVKGGIRLSFSKNPLGVRSGQSAHGVTGHMGPMASHHGAFTTVQGPPPGLTAPPGLGAGRSNAYNWGHNFNPAGNNYRHNSMSAASISSVWNPISARNGAFMPGPSPPTASGGCTNMSRRMVGR